MNFTSKNTANDNATSIKTYPSVTRYMATDLITFRPEQPVTEVIDIFLEKKISGAPVLNENQELVGIISEKDCLRVIIGSAYHNQPISTGKVSDFMTKNVKTVSEDQDVLDIAQAFLNTPIRRFPVVSKQGKVIGQVSRRDILRAAEVIEATTW
ncbi:CBS domain-containing protein [Bernardetia sp.]|uniref:CBS domain-containing protein n=1 Tax=Bernardetia sp. TaxID=1937974 RepID=UPI0025B8B306|nr:CBS domain-containing protein [Bernardetia sp.]